MVDFKKSPILWFILKKTKMNNNFKNALKLVNFRWLKLDKCCDNYMISLTFVNSSVACNIKMIAHKGK